MKLLLLFEVIVYSNCFPIGSAATAAAAMITVLYVQSSVHIISNHTSMSSNTTMHNQKIPMTTKSLTQLVHVKSNTCSVM